MESELLQANKGRHIKSVKIRNIAFFIIHTFFLKTGGVVDAE